MGIDPIEFGEQFGGPGVICALLFNDKIGYYFAKRRW